MKTNWQTKKLGEICLIKTGKKDVNQGDPNGKYPFFTCAKEHTFSNEYSFDTEALLIAGNGDVGNVSYYKGKFEAYQRTYVLSDFRGILPKYLYLYLDGFLKSTISKQKLGNTMPYIKMGMLFDFEIPVPTILEQNEIIKVLERNLEKINEVKENTEKNLRNSRELFETYLETAFNSNKQKNIRSLIDIATFRNGINFTKNSKGSSVKIVGVKDFQNSFFVPFNTLDSVILNGNLNEDDLLKDGDILVVRSNGNPKLIGRSLFVKDIKDPITHSGFTIRIRLSSKDIDPKLLCYYLKSRKTRHELTESGIGINIKSLSQESLKSLNIEIPGSLSEQRQIVKKLDQLSEKTQKLEYLYKQKLESVEELKKSILSKAFSKGL